MRREDRLDCFAVVAPGFESVAAAELVALGFKPSDAEAGGVAFAASSEGVFRANLCLRSVSRVLVRVAQFRVTAFHELEKLARTVRWEEYLREGAAAQLRVTCRKSRLYHSDAVAQRIQDAISRRVRGTSVGRVAARERAAASDAAAPDDEQDDSRSQLFVVRLDHDVCHVSADTSGALLHRRGYRLAIAKAPLRETLAAGALLASGYDGSAPFIDPMCGAGTIAIEAAMIARRIAPGLSRSFACEDWPAAPGPVLNALRAEAESRVLARAAAPIVASDRDAGAVEAALTNAQRAGVTNDIAISRHALSAAEVPPGAGLLLTNPPYGTRVGDPAALRNLYAQLGNVARRQLAGWTVAMLSADRVLERQVGLPFETVLRFKNGGLPVRLVRALTP